MITMKKDSAYFIVSADEVDRYIERGFSIVCKDSGGDAIVSPPASEQDDVVMEQVEIVEEKNDPMFYNGKRWNQLGNKAEMRALMEREEVPYEALNTMLELRDIYQRYLASIKRKKKK